MTNLKHSTQRQREYALYRYVKALERGDFEGVAVVLKQAERDAVLDQMIAEVDLTDETFSEHEVGENNWLVIEVKPSLKKHPPNPGLSKENEMIFTNTPQNTGLRQPLKQPIKQFGWLTLLAAIFVMIMITGLMSVLYRSSNGYLWLPQAAQTPLGLEKITPENVDRLKQINEIQLNNVLDSGLAFSPDSRFLAYEQSRTEVALWNFETKQVEKIFKVPDQNSLQMVFSADGKQLAAAGESAAALWNVDTPNEPLLLPYSTELMIMGSQAIGFSEDGRLLLNLVCTVHLNITGCWRIDTYGWDTTTGKQVIALHDVSGPVMGTALTSAGNLSASGFNDGRLIMRDAISGNDKDILQYTGPAIKAVALSSDSKMLASVNDERELSVWRLDTPEIAPNSLGKLSDFSTFDIFLIVLNPDNTLIATTGSTGDNAIQLWDINGHKHLRSIQAQEPDTVINTFVNPVIFSPDGKLMASYSKDGKVRIWGVTDGS